MAAMCICVLLAAFSLSAGAAFAQQAVCRTPLNVRCYTIRGARTHWQAFRNGATDIVQSTTTLVYASRRDGSTVTSQETSDWRLFGATRKSRGSWLYLSPENAIVTVNYNDHTSAQREPLIWHDLPHRRAAEHDLTCESGIRHFGTDFSRKGEATVAGVPVVIWRRSLGNGSEEQYLAPSLDCIPLRSYEILSNQWWLRTFIDSFEATSVQFGEPAADLFALPSGYRQIEDPQRAGLIRFEANGGRGAVTPKH